MRTEQGLLFRRLFRHDEGVYVCRSREHGFTQTLARLSLDVLQGETLGQLLARDDLSLDPPGKNPNTGGFRAWPSCHAYRPGAASAFGQSRSWFKDLMQLIGPSNLPQVEEYCERMWCNDKLRRKHKAMVEKYRQAQDSARKARANKGSGERNRTPRDLTGRE